nr:fibronectin type III domain-containing protein [Leucobacter komagatae]
MALRTEGTALEGKTLSQVVAGSTTTLALDSSGVVYSWGDNKYGMLGNGTYVDSPVPTPVPTPAGSPMAGKTIVHIGASGHTMGAVASDGSVFGWGSNPTTDYYEGESAMWKVPVLVNTAGTSLEGKHITQFRTGLHRLVLASDGSMYTWGYNASYQLGNGTKVFSPTPSSPMSVASYAFDGVPVALDAERRGTVPAHAPGVVDVTATFEGRTETVVGGYTYQDVPDAPTELTAVPSAGSPQTSIDVTWNNPAYTGRSAITGNPIKYRKAGDLEWSEAADSQIDGLLPGRTYEVVVHSQNSFGLSVASETASVTTTPDVTLAMLTVSLSDPLTPVVQGDTAQFTVTGANTYGDPLPVAPEDVELRSTVGRDVGTGTSMAFDTAGTRTVTATVGSVSGTVEVTASPRYIVTWDENWPDADAPSSDTVSADTLVELPDPSAAGWVITGWNTAAQGDGTPVTTSTPLADIADGPNVTLYARWERRTLELSLSKDRVAAGEAATITATANGSFGTTTDATAETEFSSLDDVATFTDGSVVSTTAGAHVLEGVFDGAVARTTVTVGPSSVDSLTLTPSATTVDQGGSLTFTAVGHDEYGNSIELDPAQAKLTSDVDTDVATGMTMRFPSASRHVVTLTYGDVKTSVTIEVRPGKTASKPQGLVASKPQGLVATGGTAAVALGSTAVALLLLGCVLLLRRRIRRDAH